MILLGLIAAGLTTDTAIQNKVYGSGINAFIISNNWMKYIMEMIKHLEESGLLNNGVS